MKAFLRTTTIALTILWGYAAAQLAKAIHHNWGLI